MFDKKSFEMFSSFKYSDEELVTFIKNVKTISFDIDNPFEKFFSNFLSNYIVQFFLKIVKLIYPKSKKITPKILSIHWASIYRFSKVQHPQLL